MNYPALAGGAFYFIQPACVASDDGRIGPLSKSLSSGRSDRTFNVGDLLALIPPAFAWGLPSRNSKITLVDHLRQVFQEGQRMSEFTMDEQNKILDQLIITRRTIRKFKNEIPSKQQIESIIQAGLLAPYAQITVTRDDFRRFVVISRDSEATNRAISLMKQRATSVYGELREKMRDNERVRLQGERFLGTIKMASENGPPNLGKAPYYVVVAEQRGIPDIAQESLAFCLQNMWLKATALGLAFQPLSFTERMAEDRTFCELLDVPYGEFALDGCLIGYADVIPSSSKRPPLKDVTRWL